MGQTHRRRADKPVRLLIVHWLIFTNLGNARYPCSFAIYIPFAAASTMIVCRHATGMGCGDDRHPHRFHLESRDSGSRGSVCDNWLSVCLREICWDREGKEL